MSESPERRNGPRRKMDKELRERLDAIEEQIDRNTEVINKGTHRTSRILATTVILLVALATLATVLISQNSAQSEDLERETQNRVAQIQAERAKATLNSCVEQNTNHDVTLVQLERLIENIKDPERRAQAEKNSQGSIALIEALAPERDCRMLVRSTVPSADGP